MKRIKQKNGKNYSFKKFTIVMQKKDEKEENK